MTVLTTEDFAETCGRKPKYVYAIEVKGTDNNGKKYTRIRLCSDKGTFDTLVKQLERKEFEHLTVKTHVGFVEWEETTE